MTFEENAFAGEYFERHKGTFIKAKWQNGVYVRLGSSNPQADFQLISNCSGVASISFDTLPMPQLTIADIDIDTVDLTSCQEN
ncbi:hypothetical protein MASR1M12_10370 [Erysipelotrichia bacterium]